MTSRKNRYLLLDGWHRLSVAKELVSEDKFWENVWCEDWELTDKQVDLLLTTLNRLRGEDDINKRAILVSTLYEQYDGNKELLLKLIPESDQELSNLLKISESGFDQTVAKLKNEDNNVKSQLQRSSMTQSPQEAFNRYKFPDDGKARLTFVFEDEEEYFIALQFFGRRPDTIKLMELINYNKQD